MVTINTTEDLLRALKENSEWREAVRAQILGEELLTLPARFDDFVANRFDPLVARFDDFVANRFDPLVARFDDFVARQQQFNDEVSAFVARQQQFNDEVSSFVARQQQFNDRFSAFMTEQKETNRRFEARFDRMEGDISVVKGGHARATAREAAGIMAMQLDLDFVRILSPQDLLSIYRSASSNLPHGQLLSFYNADLVIEANRGDETVYIVAEVSYTADSRDSVRALRNADLLTRYTGHRSIPAIASIRNDHDVAAMVESRRLHWHQMYDKNMEPE